MSLSTILIIIFIILIIAWLTGPRYAPAINVEPGILRTVLIILLIIVLVSWLFNGHIIRI